MSKMANQVCGLEIEHNLKRPLFIRDTLFWSHIRKVPVEELKEEKENTNVNIRKPDNVWIVCNNSTNFIDVPVSLREIFGPLAQNAKRTWVNLS